MKPRNCASAIVGALAMSLAAATTPASANGIWSNPIDLSVAATIGNAPQVVSSTDGRNLNSVWTSTAAGQTRLVGAFSTNHGASWSAGITINPPGNAASSPRLAGSQDGRRAVAVWSDFTPSSTRVTRTATFTDGVWADPVNVSTPTAAVFFASDVALSADGGRAAVVYVQRNGANDQIHARVSTDFGASYGPVVPVTGNVVNPADISVVSSADGLRLAAVWEETVGGFEVIRGSFSTNGGGTWRSAETLSTPNRNSTNPDLLTTADGLKTVAVWQERVSDVTPERLIQTRTLRSDIWSPSERLSTPGENSTDPQVTGATDGSRTTVVWDNATTRQAQAAHAVGDTFTGPSSTSEAGTSVDFLEVASGADGLRVTAVWKKGTGLNEQALTSESDDGGATWSVPVSLSATSANVEDTGVAAAASGFRFTSVWIRRDSSGDDRVQASTYFEARPQTIAFTAPGSLAVGGSTPLTASATSGLPVAFTTNTPGVCTVSGNGVTALAAGTCSVTASQPGDLDFLAAADVTRTLTVEAPPVAPVIVDPDTVDPKPQVLACAKTPPSKLKRRGTTVVLPKNCRTTAGQTVTVQVTGTRKSLRKVKVTKKAGKTVVRTFGKRALLTITYRAPATGDFTAFSASRTYRV